MKETGADLLYGCPYWFVRTLVMALMIVYRLHAGVLGGRDVCGVRMGSCVGALKGDKVAV